MEVVRGEVRQSGLSEDDRRMLLDAAHKGATFSKCRKYRYTLWRRWSVDDSAKMLMFIGLNPSTADETQDDPTVRRCIRFAMDWGYGGLLMMNAFAFRATDPKVMKAEPEPVGPGNDRAFRTHRTRVGLIIAAWGTHCVLEREQRICKVIDRPIHCLGQTKAGRPKHPLYLRADTEPELFWSPDTE
jgi:hypothetical protein